MKDVLATAGMGYAVSLVLVVAIGSAALVLLGERSAAFRRDVARGRLRHQLAGTLMPGMLGRLGLTLADYCDDRSPRELRTALDRCRNCPASDRCRAEQASLRGGSPDFSFCPNRARGP